MAGRHPDGHVTDHRVKMVETGRRKRRMERLLREARAQKGCSAIDGMEWKQVNFRTQLELFYFRILLRSLCVFKATYLKLTPKIH